MIQEIHVPADNRAAVAERIKTFVLNAIPGKRLLVTVEQEKRERSDAQNRYLFGVAYPPLMEHMGLRGEREKEELHELFCGFFFGWVEYTLLGVRKKRPKRTTTTDENGKRDVINTVLFMSFSDAVCQRAAENGVYIPPPDPLHFMKPDELRAA